MLFNSYIFIFLFLPICILGYFLINKTGKYQLGRAFLLGMSLWFYGYFNPAWFLERKDGGERKIQIDLNKNDDMLEIVFENNGPKLNDKYKYNPDQIFEAGETSKDEGTGLGLWICKDAVNRNSGEIHTIPIDDGFRIIINFPIGD